MGSNFDDIVASMCQDLAATAVARALEQSSDDCDMVQVSEISKSAIGELVRSKSSVPVNPFPVGVEVMNKAHDAGKYFSYSNSHKDLMLLCPQVKAPKTRVKLYVNGTRLSAKHQLLSSIIRLNKVLNVYKLKGGAELETFCSVLG